MKFKRGLFIGVLFLLFLCCYQIMNQRYDELSRYQYANNENRDLILEYMSDEEINYLIDRQYEPSQFMPYLGIENFTILKLDWYNHAKTIEKLDDSVLIDYVNQIGNKVTYSEFKKLTENYSLTQIYNFYFMENSYVDGLNLIFDLSSVSNKVDSKKTLFTYEPKNLIEVKDIPLISKDKIYLREDANVALTKLCKAVYDLNGKTCGNMVLTEGYVSFDEQVKLYEDGIIKYGIDDVLNYVDYPGQSLNQLGSVVVLIPTGIEENATSITQQQEWLSEYSKEYGFEFINNSDNIVSKFVLKYIGVKEKVE